MFRWSTALCIVPGVVFAAPTGGVVSAGDAAIAQTGPYTIVNQNTDRAIIEWQGFDVGKTEAVTFHQPSAGAVILNRIHDQKPSDIQGSITANGHVMLMNPNGVVFGKDSKVDVSGLVATSTDTTTSDFMGGGALKLTRPGNAGAAIVNEGSITAKESGIVALVAPHVVNNGIITATMGKAQLAGADTATVDLYGDGLLNIAVTDKTTATSVTHNGVITAGQVALTAAQASHIVSSTVNTQGIIQASHARRDASGQIVFGGDVDISGRDITLGTGTNIHANGIHGGGNIRVGGDYQGKQIALGRENHTNLANAQHVTIAKQTHISASATHSGDGGKVIVWADDTTQFGGKIDAKAGTWWGNGGLVETSGKNMLGVTGIADASSLNGRAGTWLLDPRDVTISGAGAYSVNSSGETVDPGSDSFTILDSSISTALTNGNNVTITTGTTGGQTGNITLDNANITKTGGANATLTLKADDSILTNGTNSISSSMGALNVILWADAEAVPNNSGSISLTNTAITTNGGDVVLGGGLDNGANGGIAADGRPDNYAWGNAANDDGISLNNGDITAGAGSITLLGHGHNNAANDQQYGVNLTNGSFLSTASEGNITFLGVGGSGTNDNLGVNIADNGTVLEVVDGNITLTGQGSGTGDDASGIGMSTSSIVRSTGVGAAAGNITMLGTGGANSDWSSGGIGINGATVTTIDGDISLQGTGGANMTGWNGIGVYLASGTISSTGTGNDAGNITLNGIGGPNGVLGSEGVRISWGGQITTVDGDISITGVGQAVQESHGFWMSWGGKIISTGTGAGAGNISITGTTGNSYGGFGILLGNDGNGTYISSVDGDVSLSGTTAGWTGAPFTLGGIRLSDEADILTTGDANITLTGNGGASANDLEFITAGSFSSGTASLGGASATGLITLIGNTLNAENLDAKTQGNIIVKARTEPTTVGVSGGVGTLQITDAVIGMLHADVDTNGTGSLIIGDSTDAAGTVDINGWDISGKSYDVEVYGSTVDFTGNMVWDQGNSLLFHSRAGDVALDNDFTRNAGTAGDGTLTFKASGSITTSGTRTITAATAGVTGKLQTIFWSDAEAVPTNNGYISLVDTTITTNGGDVVIAGGLDDGADIFAATDGTTLLHNGIAGDGRPDGYAWGNVTVNDGVTINNTDITAGSGSVTMRGRGRNAATGTQIGVYINNTSLVETTDDTIVIDGYGGNAGSDNAGVRIADAGTIIRSDTGSITLNGTGGDAASSDNHGVWVQLSAAVNSTTTAPINIYGKGGSAGVFSYGIFLGDTTISSPDGDILIKGVGAGTNKNQGIRISNTNITSNGTADITLDGTKGAGGASNDFRVQGATSLIGGANATGLITVVTDQIGIFQDVSLQTQGDVRILPRTASSTIGVSGGTCGGSCNIQLTDAILATFNPDVDANGIGSLIIGNSAAGTGTVDINGWDISGKRYDVEVYGGTVDFTGGAVAWNMDNSLLFNSRVGDIAIDQDFTRSAGTAGDGTLTFKAAGSISTSGVRTISAATAGATGKLHTILWSDAEAAPNSDGYISLTDTTITSNGGDVVLGGGLDNGANGGVASDGRPDNFAWGNGGLNDGITLNNGDITTGAGNIQMWGKGQNGGSFTQYGTYIYGGSALSSSSGNISIYGIGGNGTNDNYGVYLSGNTSSITASSSGLITLDGTGGNGSTIGNFGVKVDAGADILSDGMGLAGDGIIVNGTAGTGGTSQNYGTLLTGAGTTVITRDGDLRISGTGKGSTSINYGVDVETGAVVRSQGTFAGAGNIYITGTGGNGNFWNYGVYLNGVDAQIDSVDGDITINGIGGSGTLSNNHGIYLNNSLGVTATGDSNISLTGTRGDTNAGTYDIITANGAQSLGGVNATGTLSLTANTLSFANLTAQTQNNILIKPRTAATSIGISAGTCGGSCTLNITDAMLAQLFPDVDANGTGTLIIGDSAAGTGTVDINGWDISGKRYDVEVYGGTVDFTGGAVTWDWDNSLLFHSRVGDINIDQSFTRNAGTAGDGTLTFKSAANLYTSGSPSITAASGATSGKLDTIFWSDSDNSAEGYVSLANLTITTNGGDLVAAGGLDDGADVVDSFGVIQADGIAADGRPDNYALSSTTNGVRLQGTTINTGSGDITIRGNHTSNAARGITSLTSSVTSDGGKIVLDGRATANIAINMDTNTYTNSTGDIYFSAWRDDGSLAFNNWSTNVIESIGSGNILLDMQKGYYYSPNGSVKRIGSGTMTGDITLVTDRIDFLDGATDSLITRNNIYIIPQTDSASIGISGGTCGGSCNLQLTDARLANFLADSDADGTGSLIIGSSTAGTGTVDINGWDISGKRYDVEVYGGTIDFTGGTVAWNWDNSLLFNASTGNININQDFNRNAGTAGDGTLTLKAVGNITSSGTSTITAANAGATGKLHTVLWSDADNNGAGLINLTNVSVITNGGDFVAAGGLDDGADILAADGATVLHNGTAADGRPDNYAWGTNAGSNDGIIIDNTDIATGVGNIIIRGHGYNETVGATDFKIGTAIYNDSDLLTTSGNIIINGMGGDGNSYGRGVGIYDATTSVSTTSGAITIAGRGATTGGSTLQGVIIFDGATVESTGTGAGLGAITVNGLGGTGASNNDGIYLNTGALIRSVDANISFIGQRGTGTGSDTGGISILAGSKITSSGTGANAANITLNGSGGNNTGGSTSGILLSGTGSEIRTVDGDVSLTGTGGNAGSDNYGVMINGGTLVSTGVGASAGHITLNGTGGTGTSNNRGANLTSATLTAVDGAIQITGQANGTGGDNAGIYALNSTISSTGTGMNAATITLSGTGSDGGSNSNGIVLNHSDIATVDGNMSLTGVAGDDAAGGSNIGIWLTSNSGLTSTGLAGDGGTITLHGTGGAGADFNTGIHMISLGTGISSAYGDISLTGIAGAGSTTENNGIKTESEVTITSTGTGPSAANITLNGTAGTGTSSNLGLYISDTDISVVDGDLSLTGIGKGSGINNHGVMFMAGSSVVSTGAGAGAGTISVNGTGGDGTYNNIGFYNTAGSTLTSADGNISITGQGGLLATDYGNYGVWTNAGISTTGTGNITLLGTGGGSVAATNFNDGVYMNSALSTVNGNISITGHGSANATGHGQIGAYIEGTAISTGTGNITIAGNGGDNGTDRNWGTYITGGATRVEVKDGALQVTGQGGDGSAERNYGIFADGGARLLSTGTGATAGTITLNGTGGAGTFENYGIYTTGAGTLIEASDGAISLTGQGSGTGVYNRGIQMSSSSVVRSTGTGASAGNITMHGTGGTGSGEKTTGIEINDSIVTAVDGDILIEGTGAANSTNWHAVGINIAGGSAVISSTGTGNSAGNITINGTGGTGGILGDEGTRIGWGAEIRTIDGDIAITGTGQNTQESHGVWMNWGAKVISTGTGANAGNISITGTGGSGNSSHGVWLGNDGVNTRVTSVDGDVTVNGTTTGTGSGIKFNDEADIVTTGDANISLTGNSGLAGVADLEFLGAGGFTTGTSSLGGAGATGTISLIGNTIQANNLDARTNNNIIVKARSEPTSIGVSGGAGTLQITDSLLSMLFADNDGNGTGSLIIGDSTDATGAVDINGWDVTGKTFDVEVYGGSVGFTGGAVTWNQNNDLSFTARAGDIAIGQALTKSGGAASNLTFNATGAIAQTAAITSSSGAVNVVMDSDTNSSSAESISLGSSIASNGGSVTFSDPVLLTGATSISSGAGQISFSGTINGAQSLNLTSTGDIAFGGIVGGSTPLGAVTLTDFHDITTAYNFSAASLTISGATGEVDFSHLVTTGDIDIDAVGNISGFYQGDDGILHAGLAGDINATVTFNTLDITGQSATLLAGNIGAAGVADQDMANRISIGGVLYPTLIADPDYTFATYVIATAPSGGGGGGGGGGGSSSGGSSSGGNVPGTLPPITPPILPGSSSSGGSSSGGTTGGVLNPYFPGGYLPGGAVSNMSFFMDLSRLLEIVPPTQIDTTFSQEGGESSAQQQDTLVVENLSITPEEDSAVEDASDSMGIYTLSPALRKRLNIQQ